MAPEQDDPQPPLRRGRGLRLSGAPADPPAAPETPADAPTAHEAAPPPPVRRGQALRLSQDAAAENEAPTPDPEPVTATPLRRGRALRLSQPTAEPPETAPPSDPVAPSMPTPSPQSPPAPPPATVTRWRIGTSRGPISYLAAGSGPPLLVLHGWGASAQIWTSTLPALTARRSCYILDLPGAGASPSRTATPTLAALAAEVVAFADTLGLNQFDLLGHDLGAAVAALVAGEHPARVGRLVLLGLGMRNFAPEQVALQVARPSLDLSLGLVRPLLSLWQPVGRVAMQSPPLAATMSALMLHQSPTGLAGWQEFLADMATADPRAYLTMLTASGDPQLHAALRAIKAPTLWLAGREDRITRLAEVEAAHTLVPRSELVALAACGHMVMLEQPQAMAAALRGFFAS
ncbi:MAG: alpha/beta fold hydrolase [Oscillochloridaceae bacterium umkhey_bin13]